jgi:hypothetical protein
VPLSTFDIVSDLLAILLAYLKKKHMDDVRSILHSLLPDVFLVVHILPKSRPGTETRNSAKELWSEGLAALDHGGREEIIRDAQSRLAELIVDTKIQIRSAIGFGLIISLTIPQCTGYIQNVLRVQFIILS